MTMRVRVKLCGITRAEDAEAAVAAGADALGFVFVAGTPRYITAAIAKELVACLPPFVSSVGLFVNAAREQVEEVLELAGLRTVQFHGEETAEYCATFKSQVTVIKAFRVRDRASLGGLEAFRNSTHGWLLDAYSPGSHGGTGQRFDWDLADAIRGLTHPVIIAGGLNPDNVSEAIRRFAPFAVDVSSGVEASPGRKDPERIRAFMKAVEAGHFPAFESGPLA